MDYLHDEKRVTFTITIFYKMKKLFILFLYLSVAKINFAQAPITDTIEYLRDSIEAKRTYYIGKPLSALFKEIKSYTARIPFDSEPDTILFHRTSLLFYNNQQLVTRQINKVKTTHIEVYFTPPLQIPKTLFQIGNILDWTTGWTPEKAVFFSSYIISDLQVIGL